MKQRIFEQIVPSHSEDDAIFFSQSAFKKHYLPELRMNLCSALVHQWYECGKRSVDFFDLLKHPTAAFLERLVEIQMQSYYPMLSSEASLKLLSEDDKQFFYRKYGTFDPLELNALLEKHQVADFLEYDLLKGFQATKIDSNALSNNPDTIANALIGEKKIPKVVVLIFRYMRLKNEKWIPRSHRMAFEYNADSTYRFFDPNAGAFAFKNAGRFHEWFMKFWEHSPYRKRAAIKDFPFCTLYQLHIEKD